MAKSIKVDGKRYGLYYSTKSLASAREVKKEQIAKGRRVRVKKKEGDSKIRGSHRPTFQVFTRRG